MPTVQVNARIDRALKDALDWQGRIGQAVQALATDPFPRGPGGRAPAVGCRQEREVLPCHWS